MSDNNEFLRDWIKDLIAKLAERDATIARVRALPDEWRETGQAIRSIHATMGTGYFSCADALDAELKEQP